MFEYIYTVFVGYTERGELVREGGVDEGEMYFLILYFFIRYFDNRYVFVINK